MFETLPEGIRKKLLETAERERQEKALKNKPPQLRSEAADKINNGQQPYNPPEAITPNNPA